MSLRRTATFAATVFAVAAAAATLAAPPASAADTDIRINEVMSKDPAGGPDWFELANAGSEPVDVSGWYVKDNDDSRAVRVKAGTVIEPGGLFVFEPDVDGGFGLGADDELRIYAEDGTTLIDSVAWTEHVATAGLIPDGTGTWGETEPTRAAPNKAAAPKPAPSPVDSPIVVNEVQSDDTDGGPDWVELYNTGSEPVDISDWIVKDNDDTRNLRIPAGTVVEPGGYFVTEPDTGESGFGFGKSDSVRVYTADGMGLVDSYEWTEHASTEGRVPNGEGEFVDTAPTRGAANVARAATSIVINEVESNGDGRGDWVELANTDTTNSVDISGWSLADNNPENEAIVFPAGTEVESGGYFGVVTDVDGEWNTTFGLGGDDSVTLSNAAGEVVASFSWTEHAKTTLARCPDMTGEFAVSAEGTFEAANACADAEQPGIDAKPWPYKDDVRAAVEKGTWGEDMSGIDFAPDGRLFAVNNGTAEIFALTPRDGIYGIDESWVPRYPDGTGQPDAEGITVGEGGAIFLATERNNEAKGTSRASVLRVELGTDGAPSTTHEWNLGAKLGPWGPNSGVEGIEWISDTDAVRLGLKDADGSAYDPAAYGEHFGGVFVVAIEETGDLYVVVLGAGGDITVLQTTKATPATPLAMGLDWQAGGNRLWALCDEACDNRLAELSIQDGELMWQNDVLPPSTMPANYTNEGFAVQYCSTRDQPATFAWISDAPHEEVSLRVVDNGCSDAPSPEPSGSPEPSQTPGPGAEPVGSDGRGSGNSGRLPETGGQAPMALGGLALALLVAGFTLAMHGRRRRAATAVSR